MLAPSILLKSKSGKSEVSTLEDYDSIMKNLYKAYSRGRRMGRKGRFIHSSVVANPFKYQTPEWYYFCQGWNESISEAVNLFKEEKLRCASYVESLHSIDGARL